ncbi:MAG TPA: phenylalanine--tRNA ligase subunit beta [Candidatus Polarisedimenticolia bacterium]|nr:phenylalanine--tRNA ligase subunit beta [Candidatus Polarisedimenticolia bacterium]
MKFSHSWFKEYVTPAEDPAAIGRRLTAAGVPLDGLEGAGETALYDFDIFSNRPDCMNHFGLAREYAALTGSTLRRPDGSLPRAVAATPATTSIEIEDPDLCPRYSARCVLGVAVGPSPDWLRRRLESIGQRPINNVVDITNFVLWELGHPLHAFDLERLEGGRIVVRRARPRETLTTLDGETRTLAPEMLMIADARRPVALAGVMGGQATEIGPATRNVLLESAWFDPVSVRRTARALGLHTDASHRFERGADPEGTLPALDRAARLVAEIAGGRVTDPPLDIHPRPLPRRSILLRPPRVRSLLGQAVEETAMREALQRREFAVAAPRPDRWEVAVPSFRRDVEREVDLIEEIARHRGYDTIPSVLPLLPDAEGGRSAVDRRVRRARDLFRAAGLSEAINYSMVERRDCVTFTPEVTEPLALENPLQSQAACLRTSLLPGLLRNVAHNLNRGLPACHLFEIGTVFRPAAGPGARERTLAAFALAGRGLPAHWSLPAREVDLYDARGVVDLLGERLGLSPLTASSDRIPFLQERRALRLRAGDVPLGVLGEIAPQVSEGYGIERTVYAGEIDLDAAATVRREERRFRPLPRFPPARRDLALVVRREVTFEAIDGVIRRAATLPIAELQLFDRYQGPGVPAGSVSLAVQVVFQHPERTLAAEEVHSAQEAIVAALGRDLKARLRGAGGD